MAEPIAERPEPGRPEPLPGPAAGSESTAQTRELPPLENQGDTEVIAPLDEAQQPSPASPKIKRRKWIGWISALVVAIGIGIALWFIGDSLARNFATEYVKERIAALLGLEPGTEVVVDLGEGSVLAQAISGSITDVEIAVDDVSFGELTGDLELTGRGIPISGDAPTEELRARFAVAEADLERIGSFLSDAELQSIELDEPEIKVGSEFNVLGFITVQVGVGLTPSAEDGRIVFDPTSVRLGDDDISANDLVRQFGSIASAFLASQSFCVAEHVPEALVLSDADVDGGFLVLRFQADGTPLGDDSLTSSGVCE